ncbi:hypothetical protein [Phaeobacter italicus]|uniref:hypothetical protein n=1 Tax=Phaeobacter italicus TaxID=481446 RepID=UPI001CD1EB75|nr:hypothetical protein [Phaeobacter italicus]MCA0857147.1 hypothetical protein [Phaeobacter italicus]
MQRFQSIEDLEAMLGPNLSPAEQTLIIICSQPSLKGVVYDFGGPVDGGREANLEPGRQIRTEILLHCLYDLFETWSQRNRLFKIAGAQIVGKLPFLADGRIAASIIFDSCIFQADIEAPRLKVDGDLVFKNCHIQYLDLSGAKIAGDLSFEGLSSRGRHDRDGRSLRLQNIYVGGALIIRKSDTKNTVSGVVDLTAASVGSLVDNAHYCSDKAQYILAGVTYDRIIGPIDARTRLKWLARGDHWNGEFFPQPYKQLAKVLDDMGHEADAREVKVELERRLRQLFRRNQFRREPIETTNNVRLGTAIAETLLSLPKAINFLWDATLDWFYRSILGYGYKPLLTIRWVAVLILLCWVPSYIAWQTGGFAPNSAVMLQHSDWITLPLEGNAAEIWATKTPTGRDWESFCAIAYAADVVIPIIDLGQTEAWAPSTTRGLAGVILWWARWVFTLAGWIVTALGAAALTGVIRRE